MIIKSAITKLAYLNLSYTYFKCALCAPRLAFNSCAFVARQGAYSPIRTCAAVQKKIFCTKKVAACGKAAAAAK